MSYRPRVKLTSCAIGCEPNVFEASEPVFARKPAFPYLIDSAQLSASLSGLIFPSSSLVLSVDGT